MAKANFEKAAGKKINDYVITLTEDASLPYVKLGMMSWVARQTGCVPDVQVLNESIPPGNPELLIQCTEDLMTAIKAEFASAIAKVENAPRLGDIPPSRQKC